MPNRLLPLRMDAVTVFAKQNAKLIPAILLLCYGDLDLVFGHCRWPTFSTILLSKENREIIGGLELMSWMLLLLGRKAYALKFLMVITQVMLMISSLKLLERVINICPAGVYLTSGLATAYSFTNSLSREMVKVANVSESWYVYMDPPEKRKYMFSDLTGVDYSEGAIKLARRLADRDGFSNINLLVDDVLETKLGRQFQLVLDKGTLDAIGLHPDGSIKRIMYWESVSKLVASGGILVITSCNNTKDELVQEVENFKQRRNDDIYQEPESMKNQEASRDSSFQYLDHVRTYPTFMFGGSEGSRVATVAFLRN
ncbi:hypothetical protein NC653_029288 [Populus alba x Populus x berolinensis]|uniref:Methyltransferase domain-containing protein n=1 Tax=Populus alba x Populus x berolinensis TaxID=444605 RepID=A0AAD6M1P3_9ROSI|nr:hypothetical protein NC653_029288 [Populus alba x Populus x berolinensis]